MANHLDRYSSTSPSLCQRPKILRQARFNLPDCLVQAIIRTLVE